MVWKIKCNDLSKLSRNLAKSFSQKDSLLYKELVYPTILIRSSINRSYYSVYHFILDNFDLVDDLNKLKNNKIGKRDTKILDILNEINLAKGKGENWIKHEWVQKFTVFLNKEFTGKNPMGPFGEYSLDLLFLDLMKLRLWADYNSDGFQGRDPEETKLIRKFKFRRKTPLQLNRVIEELCKVIFYKLEFILSKRKK